MVRTTITTAKTTTIAAIVAPTIMPVDFELSSTDDGWMVGSGSCTLDAVVVVVAVITRQSSASNDSNIVGQLGSMFRISRFTAIDGADCTQVPMICTISLASITETGSCGVTLAL